MSASNCRVGRLSNYKRPGLGRGCQSPYPRSHTALSSHMIYSTNEIPARVDPVVGCDTPSSKWLLHLVIQLLFDRCWQEGFCPQDTRLNASDLLGISGSSGNSQNSFPHCLAPQKAMHGRCSSSDTALPQQRRC